MLTADDLHMWRRRRAMTQAQLADILGVRLNTVSNWEKSKHPMPNMLEYALIGIEARFGPIGEK